MKTPTLKLIGTSASRVMRNVWMLEELRIRLGVTFEHDPIMYSDPALTKVPYVQWNPNARVPILLADGEPIFESLAINLYLAEVFQTELSPATALERARSTQWALWAMTEVEIAVFDWAFHTNLLPANEQKPEIAATAQAKLQRPFDALNAHLLTQAFLVADRFTVADLNVACVMYRALKLDLSPWPAVDAWLKRCWDRESAKVPRRARGEAV